MKTMLVLALGGALAAATPLAGQETNRATLSPSGDRPAWFTVRHSADLRLAPPLPPPHARAGAVEGARSRLSFPALMIVGAAAGCVAGAVIMSSGDDVDDRERAAVRFNGCILGGAAGMFLGGVYGLVTGTRMP